VRHEDRPVPAPPVAFAPVARVGGNVEEARASALDSMDNVFESMQQPKYTPAKRKSMNDVLRTVGVDDRRAGAIAKTYGSENSISIRSGARLCAAGLTFANISDPVIATQVRATLSSFFSAPNHYSGQTLTAESLTRSTLAGIKGRTVRGGPGRFTKAPGCRPVQPTLIGPPPVSYRVIQVR